MALENKKLVLDYESFEDDFADYRPPPLWKDYLTPDETIICEESVDFKTLLYLAIFLAISYPIATQLPFVNSTDHFFIYAFRLTTPLIAGVCFLFSMQAFLRLKKFGTSTFLIEDQTGLLAGTLSGTIKTSTELNPKADYTVSLECLQTQKNGGSSSQGSTKHLVLWKGANKIPRKHFKSTEGIPISFLIPGDLPQSNRLTGDGRIQWLLKISAPTNGINYKATFLTPVFRSR